MAKVPTRRTPLTVAQAQDALLAAWAHVFGTQPTRNQRALLFAHSALETGQWAKLLNNNFGFLIASGAPNGFWSGDFFEANDSGNQRKFRAYGSPDAGAADFLRLIHFRPTWRAGLLSGDPDEYARALKHGEAPLEYFEAPLETYAQGLRSLWAQFGGSSEVSSEPAPPLTPAPQPPKPREPAPQPKQASRSFGFLIGLAGLWVIWRFGKRR